MDRVDIVVVIPIGPTCKLNYVLDTIESVKHFVTPSHVIIALDDSGKGTGAAVKARFGDVVVITAERSYGKDVGLYLNLSSGFAFAYEHYNFEVLLRMDTDALVIGPGPEAEAIDYFRRHSDVGIIGSYRVDCNGDPRDYSWPRQLLAEELNSLRPLVTSTNPLGWLKGWLFLRRVFLRSRSNGYEAGEHCLGGAYFISRACIGRLVKNNLLFRREISWSRLQEDHIFGLLIYSVGLRHGDFATGSLPMGLRWQGLPCSPEELLERQKKITHSTRFFNDLSEDDIRDYFRTQRQRDRAAGRAAP